MSKRPQFTLCDNPMANEKFDDRLFILYDGDDKIYSEVYHFDIADEEGQMSIKRNSKAVGITEHNDEYIIISAVWLIPGDKLIKMDQQQQADFIAKIMRRKADWYRSYLIWEDKRP